ncbi:acid protease [Suillus fuscotomentosus]|uniref:Acid protease n=1 Tax=Suillus fuscotomentosus TaxID=1912939 RepID=A0AAD4HKI3_9AGAM|nr:acid protease [Suillus fuscotomentosus]KAG1899516.1 acid protease [Suillus fuscotomentosus]
MMLLSLAISSIILLAIISNVVGAPQGYTSSAQQFISLTRKAQPSRNTSEWAEYAKNLRDVTIVKYSSQLSQKRGTGENLMVNQRIDTNFYGSLAVGTPPYPFAVLLDTGSSDMWVSSSACQSTCAGTGNFDSAKSSTFKNMSKSFSVTYEKGYAAGTVGQDVVQMAGFTISDQTFGVVTTTTANFLQNPVTGIFGLAWQSLAASGAMPFWQALASNGQWNQPLMAFQLTRFLNDSKAGELEPGGSFTMGYTNESLYTGTIDYQDIPNGQASYWLQQITSIIVQGKSISLPSGSASYAAIDTGTTLVAGPAASIAAIYAQIPGSQPGTGSWEGFYSYPCNTAIMVEISFGGPNWSISPGDFAFTSIGPTSDECYGAFYAIPTSGASGTPSWILGDTFLVCSFSANTLLMINAARQKNVYSVFRYDPPSVGFAALSEIALEMNGLAGGIPSATLGANSAMFTLESSAAPPTRTSSAVAIVISAFFATLVSFVQA